MKIVNLAKYNAATTVLLLGLGMSCLVMAQEAPHQGRPLDWSHSQVVASRGGQDGGASIYNDWRTIFRHIQKNQAKMERAAMGSAARRPVWAKPKPGGKAAGLKLDWSLRTGGFGTVTGYPAKYSFNITTSSCSDVIYFTVDQAGSASAVNVIAITNPYAGCLGNLLGTTPTVKFGIAMTNGTATAAVPSLDGTVLYVIENAATGMILHAINVNNIIVNPGVYNFATNTWTTTHTLAAPTGLPGSEQLFQIAIAGATNNRSSPYLDYSNNQIFVGDATGAIHRIRNTNLSTASEDTTNFPVACGVAEQRSPVFVNGQVITMSQGGVLYRIDTTAATPYTCIASAALGNGAGGELASPVIDSTNSKIIATTTHSASGVFRALLLMDLNFTAGATPISVVNLGPNVGGLRPRIPAIDDAFYNTNNGSMYADGGPSSGSNAYLIRVPYNCTVSCALGTPTGYAALHHTGAGSNAAASPVTIFTTASALANPEFVYVGGSTGTYLYMNRIASGFGGTDAAPVAIDGATSSTGFFAVPGGADSGIIVDNRTSGVTGSTATANIYFGTVGISATTQSTVVQLAQQF